MEFGPILRTLARNKTRFILITLEVALTLAVVVNCVNMMLDTRRQINRPTGIDETNIISVSSQPFSPEFKEEGYLDNSRKADLALLRELPGVRAAEVISAIPLSGSGSSSGYKPLGSELNTMGAGVFWTGTQILETLGVRLVQGRAFNLDDINEAESKNVIVTQSFADRLFPEGDALGKQLQGRTPENPDTIVGIIEDMHGSWPNWQWVHHVMLRPDEPGSFNWGIRYLVRTEPGQVSRLMPVIEERLLTLNDGRNARVQALSDIKADTYESNTAIIKILTAVIFLLVFVTALGIVGITSFSVTERTRHIGTRRALGARQWDILRYFLLENWIITTLGLALGAGLTLGLNYALVHFVSGAKLDWLLLAAGIVGLWLVGLLAALAPAIRGARVSPAVATRSV